MVMEMQLKVNRFVGMCNGALLVMVGASLALTSTSAQEDDAKRQLIEEGREIFRFDNFGDEVFWGGTLQLHQAIAGEQLGGVGPGVSPNTALSVGLKVDAEVLPTGSVEQIGRVRSTLTIRDSGAAS